MGGISGIINGLTDNLAGQLTAIVAGVAILMVIGLGIWYMVADEQDARLIKKRAFRVGIGIVVALTASAIVGWFTSQSWG